MSVLSDEPILLEMYRRLGEEGWSADAEPTLIGIVSDSKTFLRGAASLKFTAEGEKVRIKISSPEEGFLEVSGASPQTINAILDSVGVLPSSDEWIQWYREGIWGKQEGGTITPTE